MTTESPLRALAIDIDGTLIDSRKQILEFTRSEIERVVTDYGAHLILITARGPQSTAVIEERLGVSASYATFGGSLVEVRQPDGGFLRLKAESLADADVRGILTIAKAFDVHVGLYTHDIWYVSSLEYWGMREARNTAIWPELIDLDDVLERDGIDPLFKIMFRGDSEPLARLGDALQEIETSTFIHRVKHVIEIVASGAVKLPALGAVTEHLGFGLDQVIAFGDTAADVEMLEGVGIGYLMGNASPNLTVAPHVKRALSNDEDGIGIALRKHFPSEGLFRP